MNPGRTRKVAFGATGLLLFAVLVWQAYQAGVGKNNGDYFATPAIIRGCPRWVLPILVAALPTVLLSLSLHNAPLCVRDPLIVLAAALFAACFAHAYHLGRDDSAAMLRASGASWASPSLRSRHVVSWVALLAPAAVTAAIVSLATWRRPAPWGTSEDEVETG